MLGGIWYDSSLSATCHCAAVGKTFFSPEPAQALQPTPAPQSLLCSWLGVGPAPSNRITGKTTQPQTHSLASLPTCKYTHTHTHTHSRTRSSPPRPPPCSGTFGKPNPSPATYHYTPSCPLHWKHMDVCLCASHVDDLKRACQGYSTVGLAVTAHKHVQCWHQTRFLPFLWPSAQSWSFPTTRSI